MLELGADEAQVVAAVVGRWFALQPADAARPDPLLVRLRQLAMQTKALADAGEGFASEPGGGVSVVEFTSTERGAQVLGVSPKTVRKWCRLGLIPGAKQHDARGTWLVPLDYLEEHINADEHD